MKKMIEESRLSRENARLRDESTRWEAKCEFTEELLRQKIKDIERQEKKIIFLENTLKIVSAHRVEAGEFIRDRLKNAP